MLTLMLAAAVPYFGTFREAPIRAILPEGRVKSLMEAQWKGLGSQPEEQGYPFTSCMWAGEIDQSGHAVPEAWWPYEQTAYLVDGLYRLGVFLRMDDVQALPKKNLDYVAGHPRKDGRMGPDCLGSGQWAPTVFGRALMAAYDYTGDKRYLEIIRSHVDAGGTTQMDRDVCLGEVETWLYAKTGEKRYLASAQRRWARRDVDTPGMLSMPALTTAAEKRHILPMDIHGVTSAEIGKMPAIVYLWDGDTRKRDFAVRYFEDFFTLNEAPDGCPTSDEHCTGRTGADQLALHELCSVNDHMWALGYLTMATGEAIWGDRLDKMFWNAGLGHVSKDWMSAQYFSGCNQVTSPGRGNHRGGPCPRTWSRHYFGLMYSPHPGGAACCSGNLHRLLPSYVGRMWMTDRAGDPVKVLYGSSRFLFVKDGVAVELEEKSNWPYDGIATYTVHSAKPVRFAFSARIPGWTEGAEMKVEKRGGRGEGKKIACSALSYAKIEDTFVEGDVITVSIPMPLLQWKEENGTTFVTRGPCLMAYPIPEACAPLPKGGYYNGTDKAPAWELYPKGPWNWGLKFYPKGLEGVATLEMRDGTPVVKIPAYHVDNWYMDPVSERQRDLRNEASHIVTRPSETIELVPSGTTRLRIGLFQEVVPPKGL